MGSSKSDDLLPGRIRGISRTSLWKSWKAIRKDLKRSSVRDVVDLLDFDVNPDVWINRLLHRIESGDYEPEPPTRFTLGKSKGFSRTMTLPSVPDLVLYRTIVDYIYTRSRGRRYRHVYFLRDELSKAQQQALSEGKAAMRKATDQLPVYKIIDDVGQYRFTGKKSFYNWLRFDQYRKHLIYEETHEFIVVTDVSNFFDPILHSHVAEAVRTLSVPPRMVGLLHFLLEALSMRQDYSPSHGISLPTDEFDCSRTLAHMVLFPHDDAMVRLVGEHRYVRWMDDQNMAVDSKSEGLKVLGAAGRSLARLHLTPNGQKSKVLTLAEARRHYHLDLNKMLDEAEDLYRSASSATAKKRFASKVRGVWRKARAHEGVGEFSKILKRLYRLAGLAELPFLRSRSALDILADPSLVERVADYYRCTGGVADYLDFVEALFRNPEQVYPDVNVALAESLMRIEPGTGDISRLRSLTRSLMQQALKLPGDEIVVATSTLLVLRFGDASLRRVLRRFFKDAKRSSKPSIARSAAIVYASAGVAAFSEVKECAGLLLRNHLSSLVRLINEIREYEIVPKRYSSRMGLSSDSVAGIKFVDMRVVLTARLLLLNERSAVRQWVKDWRDKILKDGISEYDRRMLRRLVR